MARPRSHDKRNAILLAATKVFAERGLGAPTAAISGAAGIAEGTLFVYFKNKDDLLNELYRALKLELADAMMLGFPRRKSIQCRLQHIWDHYTKWGVAYPEQYKVLRQFQTSDRLTHESKVAGSAPFAEIETMAHDAIEQRIVQDIPLEFISTMMEAVAQATMGFMTSDPAGADKYRALGFEIFWKGITRK
jgi:AcrR family transcriptional regulator